MFTRTLVTCGPHGLSFVLVAVRWGHDSGLAYSTDFALI